MNTVGLVAMVMINFVAILKGCHYPSELYNVIVILFL